MSINISNFLEPISEDKSCGEDFSFSNDFHEIKKAKTQDDFLLDQGDWITERKQADWDFVSNKCSDLLQSKSKDIRLLTWINEAWAYLFGFEGISKGLELSHRMLEQYWQSIHPEIEDNDLDQRIGLLQGLLNQLIPLIKKVPLVNTSPFYTLLDYENFLYHQNIRRKQVDEDYSTEHAAELEQFEQALFNTSKSFQYQNYQHFSEILLQWNIIKQVLDNLMGLDAPSFAAIDSSLADIHATLRKIYKAEAFGSIMTHSVPDTVTESVPLTPHMIISEEPAVLQNSLAFQPQIQSHIANREQAMRVLQDIADYFQANEPHSPVSYMLQKTIKWSQMPLHEWLAQVIKDDQPLQMVKDILGVQPKNEYE